MLISRMLVCCGFAKPGRFRKIPKAVSTCSSYAYMLIVVAVFDVMFLVWGS